MIKLSTRKSVQARNVTKGELATELYPGITFDTAIPQVLATGLENALGYNPTSELVFVYTERFSIGLVAPLTLDIARDLLVYADTVGWDKLSLLMNWDSLGIETADLIRPTRIICENQPFIGQG